MNGESFSDVLPLAVPNVDVYNEMYYVRMPNVRMKN